MPKFLIIPQYPWECTAQTVARTIGFSRTPEGLDFAEYKIKGKYHRFELQDGLEIVDNVPEGCEEFFGYQKNAIPISYSPLFNYIDNLLRALYGDNYDDTDYLFVPRKTIEKISEVCETLIRMHENRDIDLYDIFKKVCEMLGIEYVKENWEQYDYEISEISTISKMLDHALNSGFSDDFIIKAHF